MILREFSATFDRPISNRRKEFEEKSRSILSSASRLIGNKVRTDDYWKIRLAINSRNQQQHLKVVGGVLNYCASCDEEDFFQQDVDDQKEWMLGFLRSSLIAAFHDCGIDCTQLDLLGEFVRERQFTSVFLGPKSSSGKRSAQVRCEQGFETCEVYVAITEGLEEIEKVHLTTTTPSEFAFNIFLKELSWTSYNKLELATSLGDSYAIDLDRANERP